MACLVAALGEDLETDRGSLTEGREPEPFPAAWEGPDERPAPPLAEARPA